ncbi:hypothetical protein HZR84_04395 [Hyphobacterium sp. CCMP332]|nr:hypothetical protein HZR84_04395 [Hyphobacterium sp. CCMP332]
MESTSEKDKEDKKEKENKISKPQAQEKVNVEKENILGSKSQIKAKIKPIVNLNDFNNKTEKEEEEDDFDFVDENYTDKDIRKAITEYTKVLKAKNKIGEAKLLQKEFEFEKGKLYIIIDSPVDEARYNDIKSDLLLFLRKKVKNKSLQMEIKRIELEKVKTVYTPQEKFDYLSQKNPALIELKKRLGLEFEF